MKMLSRRILALAFTFLFASASGLSAQGTIQFLNSSLSRVKYQETVGGPITDAPPGTHIGVFWGLDAGGGDALRGFGNGTLALPTAVIGGNGGIWSSSAVYAIPGTQEGQQIWMKIGGWVNGTATSLAGATHYGESDVVNVRLGPTAGPGTVVWQAPSGVAPDRMKPFIIVPIPEPSVWALGLLSLGWLVIRRKGASV